MEKFMCSKCNVPLELKEATFNYLGHNFRHEVLRCPVCGLSLVTKELAEGKMAEVEQLMEDK